HAPTVDAGEVGAEVAAFERGLRTEVVVAGRVVVEVVHAEEEGIEHRPLEPERERLLDQVISHACTVRRRRGARFPPIGPRDWTAMAREEGRRALRAGVGTTIAFVVSYAVVVGLGLVLATGFVANGPTTFDARVTRWFVDHRSEALTTVA